MIFMYFFLIFSRLLLAFIFLLSFWKHRPPHKPYTHRNPIIFPQLLLLQFFVVLCFFGHKMFFGERSSPFICELFSAFVLTRHIKQWTEYLIGPESHLTSSFDKNFYFQVAFLRLFNISIAIDIEGKLAPRRWRHFRMHLNLPFELYAIYNNAQKNPKNR